MSLKKRFYVWAMLAIALAFFQPLKAENYGAEVSTDGASVDVSQLYSNEANAADDVLNRILVKNGAPFSITLPANSNPSGVSGATLSGTTIQVNNAGTVRFYYHKDGKKWFVLIHVNYRGVLQYQGSDAPASIDVTLDNQNQTLSVPAGKFPGSVWTNTSDEVIESIPRGTTSITLSQLLASGNTSFRAYFNDGTSNQLSDGSPGGSSICEFTLVDKRTPATVSVTGVTLSESAKTLTVGETFQLTPNVQPATATDPGVTWSVAPAGIVAVGTSGLVTAQAKGQATVTVKTNDGNHTAQCVVTVVPKKHRVHFSHTGSGALTATVDNAPIQTGDEVEAGKTVVFTAAPAAGHQIKAWTPANGTATTYTVTNLSAETTVTVAFEAIPAPPPPVKHRVHFSHTGSGALTATVDNAPIQTGAEVEAGKTVVFTAAPAEGHCVKAWTPANGTATTYTVTNLSAETTVTVAFEAIPAPPPPTPSPVKHRVHFSHTGSGALTATVDNAPIQTGAEVEAGKTVVFTAAPAEGHCVKAWTPANGTATTYTVTNLSAETTVTVAFEAIPAPPPTPSPVKHRVHFSHTGSGALTATVDNAPIQTGDEVEAGKTVVFTAAPAAGHRVKAWTPANGTATTYTVTNLSAETTVTVAFEAIPAPPPPTPPSPTPNPTPDPEPPTPKKVEKLTLNHPAFEANGIASFRLEIVEILPADAADKSVTWATNNSSVATVDAQGLVTIHKKGKATLTATARDGSGVTAACLLDVVSTVANETVDGLRVFAADGALRLTLPSPETVHLYHVSGAMVKTLALPSGDHVQPLPPGMYLVRVGERVTKILVK